MDVIYREIKVIIALTHPDTTGSIGEDGAQSGERWNGELGPGPRARGVGSESGGGDASSGDDDPPSRGVA